MANPNPNNAQILLPSLSNCHSCDLQTLTPLKTLESEWRIVLLCDQCLRLVNSADKCSYCFANFSNNDDRNRFLDCCHCSRRIHFYCVPIEQRFVSLSNLNLDSFVCVDCCALPRFGGEKSRRGFTRVEIDPVVKDEELALQLHLAMNGSQRISRSGRVMNSDRFIKVKKVKKNDCCSKGEENIGFCMKDEGLIGKEEPKKEIEMVGNSNKGGRKLDGWITYRRANKSQEIGCQEKLSETKERMNGGEKLAELEQKSRCDPPDRYAKKYSKRKSSLKEVLNGESG